MPASSFSYTKLDKSTVWASEDQLNISVPISWWHAYHNAHIIFSWFAGNEDELSSTITNRAPLGGGCADDNSAWIVWRCHVNMAEKNKRWRIRKWFCHNWISDENAVFLFCPAHTEIFIVVMPSLANMFFTDGSSSMPKPDLELRELFLFGKPLLISKGMWKPTANTSHASKNAFPGSCFWLWD